LATYKLLAKEQKQDKTNANVLTITYNI